MVLRGHALAGGQFRGCFSRRLEGKRDVAVAKVSFAAALPDISMQQFFRILTLKRSPPRDEMFFAKTLVSPSYSTFGTCAELNRSATDTVSGASGRRAKHPIVALTGDASHLGRCAHNQDQTQTHGSPHFHATQEDRKLADFPFHHVTPPEGRI